ncbi:MAG: electron transfer flavoprotein subunit alpha, partial [FCB group bacterium]|nr:electron transfer flavoprotein subunit alpha [FCB group bacterium]
MKILTIADQKENALSSVSFESIGTAKALGGDVCTALLCGDVGDMGNQLSAKGSKVFVFAHADLTNFNDEAYAGILKALIDRESPDVVIGSATFYGKALMARLAALCGGGLASDCTGVSLDGDAVTALRPAYGGNVFYTVQNNTS